MIDIGNLETEREILRIEDELREIYTRAEKELQKKLDDYFRRFEAKDKIWRKWVAEGKKTKEEYRQWRVGQLAVGKRWEEQRDAAARDLANVNQIAREIVYDHVPTVFGLNQDWATYDAERQINMDTSYTLYSRDAVARVLKDNPQLLPDPGEETMKRIMEGKDFLYDRKKLQSVLMQAIIQGESIPKIAERLATEVGESDHKAAIRNARTMMTGAQNAGRMSSYERMNNLGIKTKKKWLSTHDGRTRHAHRELDEEVAEVDEPFENSIGYIMYPGDFSADAANVYNCRCTMESVIEGYENKTGAFAHADIEGMSYEEWKTEKRSRSQSITHGEEFAKTMKYAWIKKYRSG